jgi:hypothetical protein
MMAEGVFTTHEFGVEEFVRRFYKPDRLNREPGTAGRIVADRERDMARYGCAVISTHDSVLGVAAWLWDPSRLDALIARTRGLATEGAA